jgi:hypothetical protein
MPKITLADHHLIISAGSNAQKAASSLFSIAGTVYPGDNNNLVKYFIGKAIEAGISLGLNARKAVELCHLDDVEFTQTRWRYAYAPGVRETSFWEATNMFVHARQLKVRTLRHPDHVFGNDIVMTEFIVTTDRKEPASIDIFGFSWAYLSQIAPQIIPLPEPVA